MVSPNEYPNFKSVCLEMLMISIQFTVRVPCSTYSNSNTPFKSGIIPGPSLSILHITYWGLSFVAVKDIGQV